ncbi:uncharacterized protein LOC110812670 [Carica papaya]|uniref:uncharacterized protein LOC110812670 n=1 Tax=Carica papaya TaxID=3649 RepID=UPI000B8CC905|nr:uncharacterized protein LOC110812670 [Carica papaya]
MISSSSLSTSFLPLSQPFNTKQDHYNSLFKNHNQTTPPCNNIKPLIIQRSYSSSNPNHEHGSALMAISDDNKSSSGSPEEERGALETVLKFYIAIKNRNVCELSDIIGDECQCICNFISYLEPLQGKKQVVEFFKWLVKYMGDNVELVVKPTLHDGMNVGVTWKLEWNKTHVLLGSGFSFHVCQIYKGKVIIRNVEMFIDPILHLEPLRLELIASAMKIIDKLSSYATILNSRKRAACVLLLSLLFMVAILTRRPSWIFLTLFFLSAILFFSKPDNGRPIF